MMWRAEEKWGSGIVEQVSLDLQASFPETKGFSTTNLWRMKQWYLFYAQNSKKLPQLVQDFQSPENQADKKLPQLVGEIKDSISDPSEGVAFPAIFAGKLNFYVNAVDDVFKTPSQNPTIGLLICSNKDETEVQYAFKGVQTPMGVASFDNVQVKRIQEHLPSIDELKARIRLLEEELKKSHGVRGTSCDLM